MKKGKRLLIVFLILAWGLSGCRVNSGRIPESDSAAVRQSELTTIRVAVQQYYISSPIGYIIEHNLDEQFGLELVPVEYQSGAEQILDIDQDKYDLATIGTAFLYPVIEDQAVIIGEHISAQGGNAVYTRKDSPILEVRGFNPTYPEVYGNAETLRGGRMMVKQNTTLQYIGMKWLESVGVKADAVNITYGEFKECYEQLVSGEADVVTLGAPYSYLAEKEGYVKVADTESLHSNIYEVILATAKAHQEMRPELIRFMECLLHANELLEANFREKVVACENWYRQHDETFSRDLLTAECRDKTFVTRENYDISQFGEFEMKYAEYMAAIGNISPVKLANVQKNIDKDLFEQAF